jgi:hypothetical protein
MTNANPESPDAPIQDARTPSNFLRDIIGGWPRSDYP